ASEGATIYDALETHEEHGRGIGRLRSDRLNRLGSTSDTGRGTRSSQTHDEGGHLAKRGASETDPRAGSGHGQAGAGDQRSRERGGQRGRESADPRSAQRAGEGSSYSAGPGASEGEKRAAGQAPARRRHRGRSRIASGHARGSHHQHAGDSADE